MTQYMLSAFAICIVLLNGCDSISHKPSLQHGDWLQYRADAERTGYTPHKLPTNLTLSWKLQQKPPSPAWEGVHTRMTFDYAYQPVISGNTLFYGSSTDCKVYALDARTGRALWSFFTGAPVCFAPAVWRDRIFVVSDDGFLYCFSAKSGDVLWKRRGGPDESLILGNDRMISRWPVRGGVVIKDDILYIGAGIWPSDGIYIYALDPESGNVIWVNDDSGGLEWDQPHPYARAKSGIASQGYLVAAGNHLIVPTGRAVPAALNLKDGTLKYFHLQKYRDYGGSRVFATDSCLFITSGNTRNYQEIIGKRQAIFSNNHGHVLTGDEFNSQAIAISPDYIFYIDAQDHELKAIDRKNFLVEKEIKNRRGETVKQRFLASASWRLNTRQPEAVAMIIAGDRIIAGTVNNKVIVIDTVKKQVIWSVEVDGIPYGLAVAHDRLYVSTDKGSIFCFDSSNSNNIKIIQRKQVNSPYKHNEAYVKAAEEIVSKCGINDGYCLDLGCGDGQLAYELAKRANLHIYAIDSNSKNVAQARKKLDGAGIYGGRVTVHHGELTGTFYPEYFANLIVSGRSVLEGTDAVDMNELSRIQRPNGGVVCIGEPGDMKMTVRDALEGAGEWTHQYCDPANTITSSDELVKGRLGILWFRDDQMEMPSRHGRGVAPLYKDGRLFVQGNHGIRAIDAYNGHTLWEYYIEDLMKPYDQEHLTGVAQTHANWCLEGDRLYLRKGPSIANLTGRTCLVLDVATGNKLAEYRVPPAPDGSTDDYWGYIAIENGILLGTIVNTEHITQWAYRESDMNQLFSESVALFAMDATTGKLKWMYSAEHSIRHNAIAIGNGRVYLIDRPLAMIDRLRNPHSKNNGANTTQVHPHGKLVALDAETGQIIYENKKDIDGTLLALSTKHDILIMTRQYTRFSAPSETRGNLTAFRATEGKQLWQVNTRESLDPKYPFSSRPIINDTTIFLEPNAFGLKTGEKLNFSFERTYACGIITSSKNMLLFRSSTMGYFDLAHTAEGTQNFGGIRPGCWINTLPVGGIVLMPDATDRCNCSYLNKATIALQPME